MTLFGHVYIFSRPISNHIDDVTTTLTRTSYIKHVIFCKVLLVLASEISRRFKSRREVMEDHFDEYEHYNFAYDKYIFSGHSGKGRSKKEASLNTNHFDPSGHTRKMATKFINTHHNHRERTKSKWTKKEGENCKFIFWIYQQLYQCFVGNIQFGTSFTGKGLVHAFPQRFMSSC